MQYLFFRECYTVGHEYYRAELIGTVNRCADRRKIVHRLGGRMTVGVVRAARNDNELRLCRLQKSE